MKMSILKRPIHYPQLNTVLMVEDSIKNMKDNYTKKQVWKKLPRKVMYQTFCVIMNYLERSNKITYDSKGNVVWIFSISPKLQNLLARSVDV